MFTFISEHFEFRHFRSHYLDVDTIFGDLRRECLHQRVVRNTIFRKAPKLCKRAQKISAAAPLRVMASRYNPCE
jgi:hypothetical protein